MCAGEWPNACDPVDVTSGLPFRGLARNEFHLKLERLGDDTCSIPRRRPSVSRDASFRVLYVVVVLEVGARRIVRWNVTEHPTADRTIQQFRAVIIPETVHRFMFMLNDRDGI
jgi:hypothetical protein